MMKKWFVARAIIDHILVMVGGAVVIAYIGYAAGYLNYYNTKDALVDMLRAPGNYHVKEK